MKVVILAGGFGTRLAGYTETIPKPMVEVGGRPILYHIMDWYAQHGHRDFYIALGYRGDYIKRYFLDFFALNSNLSIDLSTGTTEYHGEKKHPWKVTLVDTGLNSMTGGRVLAMKPWMGDETFLLTYGDGLSDVPLNDAIEFHRREGRIATLTAVRPTGRFGELAIEDDHVRSFQEKPPGGAGWVNGGFFVLESGIFDYLDSPATVLEQAPLESLARENQLSAYLHDGFWQCMDTPRDKQALEEMFQDGSLPLRGPGKDKL